MAAAWADLARWLGGRCFGPPTMPRLQTARPGARARARGRRCGCSRFRDDSELARLNQARRRRVRGRALSLRGRTRRAGGSRGNRRTDGPEPSAAGSDSPATTGRSRSSAERDRGGACDSRPLPAGDTSSWTRIADGFESPTVSSSSSVRRRRRSPRTAPHSPRQKDGRGHLPSRWVVTSPSLGPRRSVSWPVRITNCARAWLDGPGG